MTRRTALQTGLAVPMFGAGTSRIKAIVERNDGEIARLLKSQTTDADAQDAGGFKDEYGLAEAYICGGALSTYTAGFLHADSRFYRDRTLAQRISSAGRFLIRKQHSDGLIDLLRSNFHSPPDTGFVVHEVATAACLLKRAGEQALFGELERFLIAAGRGLVTGGVHTANHRWVVCSALAQLHELFRDPAYTARIDQWLRESVDIDEDGQFTERSTSVYDAACDRAFVVMAHKLNRPQLLESPRRNLAGMLYLLHDNLEVVTEISRRQDQYSRAGMGRFWFPLTYLALHDGNGVLMSLVDRLEPEHARLSALLEYPELAAGGPDRMPLPTRYERHFPALAIARFRDAAMSATLLADNPTLFALRNGDAVIESVSVECSFFGKGQFAAASLIKGDGRYTLNQTIQRGYWQVFEPSRVVQVGTWGAVRPNRPASNVCRLEYKAELQRTREGFDLRIVCNGTEGVPAAIRIGVAEGTTITGCDPHPQYPDEKVLRSQFATVAAGGKKIRFGPGVFAHSYTRIGEPVRPPIPGIPVYLTAFTPFDRTLHFELS